jgi:hypothetical protein
MGLLGRNDASPRVTSRYSHVSIDPTSRLTSQHPRYLALVNALRAQDAEAVEFFRRCAMTEDSVPPS